LNAQIYSQHYPIAIETLNWQRKHPDAENTQVVERRMHESPHIKPKETQMGMQTYALTSGGLYDNGQATLFFWGSHSNEYRHNITLLLTSSANT
jgi:hypothetical protein